LQNLEEIKRIATNIPRHRMHISLIYRRNKLLAWGTNHTKMHPKALRMGYRTPYLHSELDAYRKVQHMGLKNLTLVNYRFKANGLIGLSKPCPICMLWCTEIFNKIFYSNNEGSLVKL